MPSSGGKRKRSPGGVSAETSHALPDTPIVLVSFEHHGHSVRVAINVISACLGLGALGENQAVGPAIETSYRSQSQE
jgi:hypothetical protein